MKEFTKPYKNVCIFIWEFDCKSFCKAIH